MSEFEIPQEFSDALNQGLAQDGGIRLPFTAPLVWWVNGNAQNKALAKATPAMYYGGWMMEESHMDDAAVEFGGIPAGFVKTDFVNHKGDEIPTYSARAIVMAPMAYRVAWVNKGSYGVRYQQYQPGTSMHVQMLALLGTTTANKTYTPWGPVVLSAKAFQAGNLTDATKAWANLINPVLRKAGSKTPPSAFWMGVGTFGEFAQKMVGKSGAQSPITPIALYQPPAEKVNVEFLKTIFTGKDTVAKMADYIAQAAEWLNAWKQPARDNGPVEPEWSEEPPAGPDIPF